MNPNAFKGTLTPEPKDFTIEVDRLIIRSNEIAFEMHGKDNETGPYDVEGKCFKQRTNYYKGPGQYRDLKPKSSSTKWSPSRSSISWSTRFESMAAISKDSGLSEFPDSNP